jgi:hypothetical protein
MEQSILSPTRNVPAPSTIEWSMLARSTPTRSPTRLARSAIGPPSLPLKQSSSASICSSEALSSTSTTWRQFPSRMLPGMCTTLTSVSPPTSTPRMFPLVKLYATTDSQNPLSGSSPIQQGQSVSQLQTSSRLPSSW